MSDALNNLLSGLTSVGQSKAPIIVVPDIPIPMVPLALDLYNFQDEAVAHAMRDTTFKPYGYIGLDMGLGKTPCGIKVAASCAAAGVRPVLIVVPPSLRVQWHREVFKFAPWLTMATIRSAKPDPGDVIPDVDVLVLGDSSVAGWADFLTGKVGALIVDEAHRFKNKSKRSEGLAQIASGIKKVKDVVTKRTRNITVLPPGGTLPRMRVLMSGTATPNGRHQELATQIDVLGDNAWRDIGGKGTFWHHYAPQVDAYGARGSEDGESLHEAMVNSWYFRRLRDDVLELPAKGRTALHLEGRGRVVDEYKQVEDDLIRWLAGKHDGKVTQGQVRAQALIKMLALRHLAGQCKVKAIIDHAKEVLDEVPGGLFIVAEHSNVIDDLTIGLSKYNPSVVEGGMSDSEKSQSVDAFCNGTSRVLIGQITAAGVGLTLHGGGINHHVIVAQLPWTPAELTQAEDRLHRIGQTKDVLVEVALCAIEGTWTIDERLWNMLEGKHFASGQINNGVGTYLLSEVQDSLLDSYRDQGRNL